MLFRSVYVEIGLSLASADNKQVSTYFAIVAGFILLTLELSIETVIRKQILVCLKKFYEACGAENEDFLRALEQEED